MCCGRVSVSWPSKKRQGWPSSRGAFLWPVFECCSGSLMTRQAITQKEGGRSDHSTAHFQRDSEVHTDLWASKERTQ